MRHVFRPVRENPDSLVEIPFRLNRRLSHAEFWACAKHYILVSGKEYFARLASSQQGRRPQIPSPEQWPNVEGLGVSPVSFWNFEIPIGQLYFAETKQQQKQARKRINALTQRGPNDVRRAVAKARRRIPQAKATLSGRDRFNLFLYRAQRQFLWIFLRYESEWDKGQLKEGKSFDRAVQALAEAYSYLDLTPATIAEGLRYSH